MSIFIKGGTRLEKNTKKNRPKQKRLHKMVIRRYILIILGVMLMLLLSLFIVYRFWARRPSFTAPPQNSGGSDSFEMPGTVDPDDPVDRKKDFFTFLIVGRDTGGGGNTDTILLVAYDIPNQQLSVMSIPRDTMVNVSWDIKRINSVYNANGGGDKGIQALYKEVSRLVGFIPDYKIVVEWKAVGELVEAIGGVYFDVPRNMNYDDPIQNLHIHVNKGYQKLNGKDAMGVVRWRWNNDRSGYITGDIGRIETQQAFLKAVVEQCLRFQNVVNLQEFANVFTENVETDLTTGNLVWFAEQAIFGGLKIENVNFVTLPGDYSAVAWSRIYKKNQSYVTPDGEALLALVNERFNPYFKDRDASQQDIMRVNKDGSLSSSTGVLEDTQAAKPPVKPAPTPEQTPVVTSSMAPTPSGSNTSVPGDMPTPSDTQTSSDIPLTGGVPPNSEPTSSDVPVQP